MQGARPFHPTVLLAFLLVLPLSAQAPTDNGLTNTDIVKMVKAGLPESIIVREIQMSRADFSTGPNALIELKKQGASEKILGAVLDSRMGPSRAEPESRTTLRIRRESRDAGTPPSALL